MTSLTNFFNETSKSRNVRNRSTVTSAFTLALGFERNVSPLQGDNSIVLALNVRSKETNQQTCWQVHHVRCGCLATGSGFCFKANWEQLFGLPHGYLSFAATHLCFLNFRNNLPLYKGILVLDENELSLYLWRKKKVSAVGDAILIKHLVNVMSGN